MILFGVLTLSILPFILLFVYANRRRMLMEVLPSVFWLFFMSMPFLFLSFSLQSEVKYKQAIGVILVSSLTHITDFICLKIHIKKATHATIPSGNYKINTYLKRFFLFLILFLFIIVPILHVYTSHIFPLLELLSGSDSQGDLQDARQAFTKGANFSLFFQIIVVWFVPIFSLLLSFILYKLGFKRIIVLVMFFSCLYAVASLEKFQILFLLFTCFLSFRYLLNGEKKVFLGGIFVKVLTLFCLILNLLGLYMVVASDSHRNDEMVERHILNHQNTGNFFTPADYFRLGIVSNSFLPERLENFVYRTVLAPVDVSFRWYQYYSIYPEKRDFRKFISNSEDPKASNVIAKWYLVDRFPDKYRTYANAYTSIDSDAYSVYGNLGIFLFYTILGFVRILAKRLSFNSSISQFTYGMIVAHLSVLPMMAGIWSILFSRGVILLLFIVLISSIYLKYSERTII